MRQLDLGKTGFLAPEVALGCMRMAGLKDADAQAAITAALESGINFFDHADIYGQDGLAEQTFGQAVKKLGIPREEMLLQTKCGIFKADGVRGAASFNFSQDYIISCVEKSLGRLQVDYIDLLALHRPDTLMEPEEVAAAFDKLHTSGKVRCFGVSNQNPGQMALLQKYTKHKLVVNQLQFGLVHTGMIDSGINSNMKNPASIGHDGGTLEYCRLNDITIQAWSPFRPSVSGEVFLDNPAYPELNAELYALAGRYGVTKDTIATAWILRHPAKMQVIVGSMNPERIRGIAKCAEFSLTHDEWYALYRSAGNVLP